VPRARHEAIAARLSDDWGHWQLKEWVMKPCILNRRDVGLAQGARDGSIHE